MPKPSALFKSFEEMGQSDRAMWKMAARIGWAKKCAAVKDILGWGAACFPDKFTLPFCMPFHSWLVKIRQELLTGTEGPRNHAKTIISCFLIPIFQSLEEPLSFRHYLNVQATGTKADTVNLSIRHELEYNPIIREIYGDQVGREKWGNSQFVMKNGVIFSAVGAGQSIRGLNYNNIRPQNIRVDDLFDKDHISNLEATRKMNDWFLGDLYPARDKSWPARIHVTGTAINNYDLLEKMKKMEGVTFKTFQSRDEVKHTVLWPELNTWEQLEHERTNIMGSLLFAREMQNERRDETTAIIKYSWLYPTDGRPSWEFEPADLKFDKDHVIEAIMLLCDPSIGEKIQNDYTGCTVIIKTRFTEGNGNRFYIMRVEREQVSLYKRVKLLSDIAAEQAPDRQVSEVRIESIAGFKDFTAEVRRKTNLPVKEIDVVKDKIANLENKSVHFESRRVFLNKHIDPKLKERLVYELTTNYPDHDDMRDSALLGLDPAPTGWNFVG